MESFNPLIQSCKDILTKNLQWISGVPLYFLYDTKSPGAKMLEQGYIEAIRHLDTQSSAVIREFLDPPQPLFQSGFVQPVNPHHQSAQIASQHNIQESAAKGIESLTKNATQAEELLSQECQEILAELKNLPKDSCVVLVQSTNFRLSAFRIRLELFQRGIHVIEHNHLAYIPEQQLPTLVSALEYRSDTYARQHKELETLLSNASSNIHIKTPEGDVLTFGAVESTKGNTGKYQAGEVRGGTFPIGEVFTESKNLNEVSGICRIETYPGLDFSIRVCSPFPAAIIQGKLQRDAENFPSDFLELYDRITEIEGCVMVRELGFGLNPAISAQFPLQDINYHERKLGIHLSLGKKHGIYAKKLPKTEVQRFHIDVFLALDTVHIGDITLFKNGNWNF